MPVIKWNCNYKMRRDLLSYKTANKSLNSGIYGDIQMAWGYHRRKYSPYWSDKYLLETNLTWRWFPTGIYQYACPLLRTIRTMICKHCNIFTWSHMYRTFWNSFRIFVSRWRSCLTQIVTHWGVHTLITLN